MKTGLLLLGFILISANGFAQESQSTEFDTSATIAEIDGEPITLGQLIASFNQNQDSEELTAEELVDFLPSFVDYKLKLRKGRKLRYHQHPEILEEFEQFGIEASYIYWLENNIKQEQIRQFRERDQVELRAFHILSEVPDGSSDAFEDSVYNRMLEARELLTDGHDPEQVDAEFSSKRNGNSMGGQLPWITAGRTVLEFEDAIYTLEPGEISEPVRTQFGYHVIFLQEKRERTPDRRISHIFTQRGENNEGLEQIEEAYRELEQGLSWQEAVQNYTQDGATMNRNGQIGWVGYAMQFPEEFVDEVMETDPEAPYSEPIEMSYGYHIIRVDSVRTYIDDKSYEESITNRLQQLQRLDTGREQVYETVGRTGGLVVEKEKIEELLNDFPDLNLSLTDKEELKLIEFLETSYTLSDFLNYLEANELVQDSADITSEMFDEFKKEIIRSELIHITKSNFPDFSQEMTKFLDGLVVFRVNEEYIWNHETADRDELKAFFDEHRDRYIYDDQYEFYRVSSLQQDLTEDALNNVRDGIHPSDLHILFNDLSVLHDSTRSKHSSHYPHISVLSPGESTDIIERGSLHTFYYLVKIEPSRPMTFDEAFFRVASDFQPIREEQFLKRLHETWQVDLYPENIQ